MTAVLIAALFVAIAIAGFAVQNAQPVTVHFLTRQWETSLVIVIFGAAISGALAVALAGTVRGVRLRLRIRALQQEIQRLRDHIRELEAGDSASGDAVGASPPRKTELRNPDPR